MAYTDQLQAAVMPIDTSVSIDADRCRAFFTAPPGGVATRHTSPPAAPVPPAPTASWETDSPGSSS